MIKFNLNFTVQPSNDATNEFAPDHKPEKRRKIISTEDYLENICLRHGKFIHDLVVNYLDMPEIALDTPGILLILIPVGQ